jgi:hypothetical protein
VLLRWRCIAAHCRVQAVTCFSWATTGLLLKARGQAARLWAAALLHARPVLDLVASWDAILRVNGGLTRGAISDSGVRKVVEARGGVPLTSCSQPGGCVICVGSADTRVRLCVLVSTQKHLLT